MARLLQVFQRQGVSLGFSLTRAVKWRFYRVIRIT